MPTLGDLAGEVRSKNAGPFWITMDIFFKNAADYDLVMGSGFLTRETIGRIYKVDPACIKCFEISVLNVVKISFPRPVTAGSFEDRDLHAGQQHVPLSLMPLTMSDQA